jgi:hypothetical protein
MSLFKRTQEIRERAADAASASIDANDQSLTPQERRTAQQAADGHRAAIRDLRRQG